MAKSVAVVAGTKNKLKWLRWNDEMIEYFHNFFKGETDKRKSAKGKDAVNLRKQDVMRFFSKTNKTQLANIFS